MVRLANVSNLPDFYGLVPRDDKPVTSDDTKQIINEIHHQRINRFPRLSFQTHFIDEIWELDLLDMVQLKNHNYGKRFIVVCIDTFSKFIFLRGIKQKSATCVTLAVENIFEESKRVPRLIHCDRGREFYNRPFMSLLKQYKIKMYSNHSHLKAAIVERANRSLRSIIMKWVHESGSGRWINHLSHFADIYNSRKHSKIKMAPKDCTKENEEAVYLSVYSESQSKICENPKYKVNDVVRLSVSKKTFEKSSEGNFTHEMFYVARVYSHTFPCTYGLINSKREAILGKVYALEMVRVKRPALFIVDEIVRRKKESNQALVRFKGMDSSYDKWMNLDDVYDV